MVNKEVSYLKEESEHSIDASTYQLLNQMNSNKQSLIPLTCSRREDGLSC